MISYFYIYFVVVVVLALSAFVRGGQGEESFSESASRGVLQRKPRRP